MFGCGAICAIFSLLTMIAGQGPLTPSVGPGLIPLANGDCQYGVMGFGGDFQIAVSRSAPPFLRQGYQPGYPWNALGVLPTVYCRPGECFELAVDNRNTVTGGDVLFGVRFLSLADGKLRTVGFKLQAVPENASGWTRSVLAFKVPDGVNALALYCVIDDTISSGTVDWNHFQLQRVAETVSPLTVELPSAAIFPNDRWRAFADRDRPSAFLPTDRLPFRLTLRNHGRGWQAVVRLTDGNGVSVAQQTLTLTGNEESVSGALPWLRQTPGYYELTVELRDGNRTVQTVRTPVIVNPGRLDTSPLEPVKDSAIDGCGNLTVNGRPFTMRYFYHNPLTADGLTWFRQELGVNCAPVWGGDSIDELVKNVDLAWRCGLYSWAVLFHGATLDGKKKQWKDRELTEAVNRLKNHPGLIGWDLCDEPDLYKIPAAEVMRARQLIRRLDPHHLIWVNLCVFRQYPEYAATSDLAAYDSYPFPSGTLRGTEAHNRAVVAAHGGRPVPLLCCLQTFAPVASRSPTYEELRAETYLGIVQGMKCFAFFAWNAELAGSSERQSYLRNLLMETAELEPFLFAPTPPQPKLSALDRVGIRYLFKLVQGKKYLVTVNPENRRKVVSFALPDGGSSSAHRLFETASPAVSAAAVRAEMAPWQVRIYVY